MTSEVTSDLISEISGLYDPCNSAFLAPKCFLEPFKRKEGRKEERKKAKSTCRSACSFLAADEKNLQGKLLAGWPAGLVIPSLEFPPSLT